MINQISAAVIIGGLYLTSFPIGYVILKNNATLKRCPFFVALPIYVSLGLSALTSAVFAVSFLFIHGFALMFFGLFAFAVLLYDALRKGVDTKSPTIKVVLTSLIASAPLLISFVYFVMAAAIMSWPAPGDIIGHGLLVSILRWNGRQLLTLEPLISYPLYYPTGMHVLAADIANLTWLYSGEAVLLVGAMVSSLIPPLIFSLTYILTNSLIISLIPYLASFYIHSSGSLETWLMGYFFNGPYPCLFGFLSYILLVCLLILLSKENSSRSFFCITIVLLQLLVTYPLFFLTAAPLCVLLMRKQLLNFIRSIGWRRLVLTFSALFLLLLLVISPRFHMLKETLRGFEVSPYFFYDRTIVVVLSAVPMCFFLRKRGECKELSLFFLATLFLVIASLNERAFAFLQYTLPNRLILITWVLSWIVLSLFITYILRTKMTIKVRTSLHTRKSGDGSLAQFTISWARRKNTILKLACVALALLPLQPSLLQHASLASAYQGAWYSNSDYYRYDRNASMWISAKIPSHELILNDLSWSGFYLPSYTYKNVIFHYFPHPPEYNEAKQIWLHPNNETLVRIVIRKLGIKWVFVTSSDHYLDTWIYGGDQNYKEKPFRPADYGHYFDSYQFLQIAFSEGNTRIYKVIWSLL